MGIRGAVLAVIVLLAALLTWLAWPGTTRGVHDVVAGTPVPAPLVAAPTAPPARTSEPEPRTRVEATQAPADESAEAILVAQAEEDARGSLVVRVLHDGRLAQARVTVGRLEPNSDFLFGGELFEDWTFHTVSGFVRFRELVPGQKGLLVGGARCVVDVVAGEERTVVVPLGSAHVFGSVHGDDGAPAPGTRVIVRQFEKGQPPAWYVGSADADGDYVVEGLAPDRTSMAAAVDLFPGESPSFTLAPGEARRIDFGSSAQRVTWSGTVRLPGGAPVGMHCTLYFRCGDALLRGWSDADGRFSQQVPTGSNEVFLHTPQGGSLGTVEITTDIEHDLVIPGGVLRGTARYVGTKHPRAEGPEREVVVTLCGEDGGVLANTPMRGAASYVFTGLQPGRYFLRTSPWPPVGAPDGSVPAELPEGVDEVVLDLDITDP